MSFSIAQTGVDSPIPFYTNVFAGQTYQPGQGVISLRFDDGNSSDYETIYPLLVERGLVAGFPVIRRLISGIGRMTLAQLLEMQAAGMEIMCHSRLHGDDPTSFATFKDETLKAASEMWMIGLHAVSWVQPGTWVADYNITDPAGDDAVLDSFLRSHFAAYEAYGISFDVGLRYYLPRSTPYAAVHNTCDAWTLEQLDTLTSECKTNGQATNNLFHSANIGGDGYISLANFTTYLDHVAADVTAGDIVVMTPTQQSYATEA